MKKKVEVSTEIEITIDENSQMFKELFKNYQEYFCDCDGDLDEFCELIATEVARKGDECKIEGLGTVSVNGNNPEHPIKVVVDCYACGDVEFDTYIKD